MTGRKMDSSMTTRSKGSQINSTVVAADGEELPGGKRLGRSNSVSSLSSNSETNQATKSHHRTRSSANSSRSSTPTPPVGKEGKQSNPSTPVAGTNKAKDSKPTPSSGKKRSLASMLEAGDAPSVPPPKMRKIGKNDGTGMNNKNDYFCWICHRDGNVIVCEVCPRVYHAKCLGLENNRPKDWVCPECEKILRAECVDTRSKSMSMITLDQLCMLLKFTLERMQHPTSQPFERPVDLAAVPLYGEYIYNPMDLGQLEKNIDSRMYGCTEAFLADAKWILHNCIIYNGTHHKLTSSAKLIIKICKHETNEIEICPDCYMNSCLQRNDNWFCEPCRTPHTLVWAKLKGYPFWPAKALREVDGQVDVRFFGAHDRSWVPVSQVFLLSETIPTTFRNKKANGFDQAMDELQVHIDRIREEVGSFEYAEFRTPYDMNNVYFHNKMKIFDKSSLAKVKTKSQQSVKPPKLLSPPKSSKQAKASPVQHKAATDTKPSEAKSTTAKTASAVKIKYNSIITTRRGAAAKVASLGSSSSATEAASKTDKPAQTASEQTKRGQPTSQPVLPSSSSSVLLPTTQVTLVQPPKLTLKPGSGQHKFRLQKITVTPKLHQALAKMAENEKGVKILKGSQLLEHNADDQPGGGIGVLESLRKNSKGANPKTGSTQSSNVVNIVNFASSEDEVCDERTTSMQTKTTLSESAESAKHSVSQTTSSDNVAFNGDSVSVENTPDVNSTHCSKKTVQSEDSATDGQHLKQVLSKPVSKEKNVDAGKNSTDKCSSQTESDVTPNGDTSDYSKGSGNIAESESAASVAASKTESESAASGAAGKTESESAVSVAASKTESESVVSVAASKTEGESVVSVTASKTVSSPDDGSSENVDVPVSANMTIHVSHPVSQNTTVSQPVSSADATVSQPVNQDTTTTVPQPVSPEDTTVSQPVSKALSSVGLKDNTVLSGSKPGLETTAKTAEVSPGKSQYLEGLSKTIESCKAKLGIHNDELELENLSLEMEASSEEEDADSYSESGSDSDADSTVKLGDETVDMSEPTSTNPAEEDEAQMETAGDSKQADLESKDKQTGDQTGQTKDVGNEQKAITKESSSVDKSVSSKRPACPSMDAVSDRVDSEVNASADGDKSSAKRARVESVPAPDDSGMKKEQKGGLLSKYAAENADNLSDTGGLIMEVDTDTDSNNLVIDLSENDVVLTPTKPDTQKKSAVEIDSSSESDVAPSPSMSSSKTLDTKGGKSFKSGSNLATLSSLGVQGAVPKPVTMVKGTTAATNTLSWLKSVAGNKLGTAVTNQMGTAVTNQMGTVVTNQLKKPPAVPQLITTVIGNRTVVISCPSSCVATTAAVATTPSTSSATLSTGTQLSSLRPSVVTTPTVVSVKTPNGPNQLLKILPVGSTKPRHIAPALAPTIQGFPSNAMLVSVPPPLLLSPQKQQQQQQQQQPLQQQQGQTNLQHSVLSSALTTPRPQLVSNFDLSSVHKINVDKYTEKIAAAVKNSVDEMYRDLTHKDTFQTGLKYMQLEIERLEWKNKQEVAEMKHNLELTIAELRKGFETEKRALVEQLQKKYEEKAAEEKRKAVDETKKKQWCANCGKEAIFYCCWNTSYCDYPCQTAHWPQHMDSCTQSQSSEQPAAPANQSNSTPAQTSRLEKALSACQGQDTVVAMSKDDQRQKARNDWVRDSARDSVPSALLLHGEQQKGMGRRGLINVSTNGTPHQQVLATSSSLLQVGVPPQGKFSGARQTPGDQRPMVQVGQVLPGQLRQLVQPAMGLTEQMLRGNPGGQVIPQGGQVISQGGQVIPQGQQILQGPTGAQLLQPDGLQLQYIAQQGQNPHNQIGFPITNQQGITVLQQRPLVQQNNSMLYPIVNQAGQSQVIHRGPIMFSKNQQQSPATMDAQNPFQLQSRPF